MRYRGIVMKFSLWFCMSLLLAGAFFVVPAALAQGATEPVCVQCHSQLPEKYSQPVTLWRGSIHAENGISCQGCHGGDPLDAANAMSPARGFLGAPKEPGIPAFCGRCHVGVMNDYLASAHGRMLGKGGPTCVTCHGSHQVVKAALELISENNCGRCHSYQRAGVIRAAMQATEASIVAADARLSAYKKIGADTEKLEKELFAVRNHFHSLFHNVNVELVKKETARIQADLKKIEAVLDRLDDTHQKRRIAGAVVISLLLLTALLLHFYRKTFD